ncbi:ABC transporter D family member 1-like isoform X1 [Gossypium arboreum]|uniref:ABC transporter D family member 1-like isoform X1 n=1 Tax=Gossypium arboreum TaxID=29729 RepID=UPI0022F1B001|nr:ABC transporter D family member 1-like isoform X1 [Gossypium arboreum]XP_052878289.1 ABC transporter D family member 1-like isoform X1 [Gossypium arboreum]XP_052878290.1 ABC transporter D family member 1-like isoform X1 [Gossypium arboreum]
MPSLQLLQLTDRGRNLLASRRKAVLLASGIVVAGGTAAYLQSRFSSKKPYSYGHSNGVQDDRENSDEVLKRNHNVKGTTRKRGGLKSLQVLTAILLSKMGQTGARDLLALVGIVVLRTALTNRLAKVQGFLFRAAFLQRVPSFFLLISENILLCFLLSTFHSTSKYITGTLSLSFRKILTKLIHTHYFENMAYYKISHVDGRIRNPEQRIASDVPRFCSELSELVQDDLTAVTDGLLYTWRLCSYASPKYIFWILAYVLGAGAAIRNFSPAFGKLMSKEQQLEGEYRQLHSRLRTHAESIAFYGGESREESHIQQKFKNLVRHLRVVLHDHWWFGMIQDFLLKYLGATVAVVLIIEPFFAGNLRPDTSTLGRAEMLSNLRYHTSVVISLFQALGTLSISSRRLNRLSGYADRIHELMLISRELSAVDKKPSFQRAASRNYLTEANYVEFSNVKVVTPSGNVLVKDLSLRVESGSNLLITGPNGSGKSSLFRVLGGLWPLVSGHIVKPGVGSDLNKEIFYVPQRPYTAVGTLRDQLIYPLTADQEVEPLTHDGMVELLKNVDLEYLLNRYQPDKEVNWGDELSLGEQQRLGMARLFYHKPKFAILDECTSAVTTDMEERFCAKVRAMGTSCITISHRPALVAFHDVVLSLNGEGGWTVHYKSEDSPVQSENGIELTEVSETNRQTDAIAVQRAFTAAKKDSAFSNPKTQSYVSEVIAASPSVNHDVKLPVVPQVRRDARVLPLRVAAMFKVLEQNTRRMIGHAKEINGLYYLEESSEEVPTLFDKQGAQLLAVALLVVSRTWVSDRIASLNGTTVKHVLEQDKAAFIRLIGISVLQSAASSFIAPSLRHLTARLALGWRIRLTQHLLKNYLRNNAFYQVFHMSSKNIDADQRITHDLEKLTTDISGLVTGMVKPFVDILWFTWRMKLLTGQRGVAILYAYMLLGLGFLRTITPDFGDLTSREQQLEGTFRFMHERLRTHAESIAFFGGGAREKAMVESRFRELLDHSLLLLKKKWLFGILDDFVTKQLPHNVTWGLSLLYALEHKGDRALVSTQGELAHALRFLASVVSQSFLAFGDILELHKKFLELSGSINRIFELEELLDAAQSGDFNIDKLTESQSTSLYAKDIISFANVDIISPAQKLLAKQLTCDVVPGKSLLVTGPNGSGKSSVFRVLRGLWPIVTGRLYKPIHYFDEEAGSSCAIFYVPQRPYTCLGTLRDQIIYPLSREEAEMRELKFYGKVSGKKSADAINILDARLKTILENVRLNYLLQREDGGWDSNLNWEDTLSLGEQQRLGMARLFFHKPKFGILDECTNATSVDVEEQLYRVAKDLGITVITSSQRPALIPFHALELRLVDGEGKWELRSIKQ